MAHDAAIVTEMAGPMLHWPQWVLAVAPLHHLAAVPVDVFALLAAIVMIVIGTALAIGGIVGFQRPDLVAA